jgi:hypothetical protein
MDQDNDSGKKSFGSEKIIDSSRKNREMDILVVERKMLCRRAGF